MEMLSDGTFPREVFTADEEVFNLPYFLVDGIYPHWPICMDSCAHPTNEKERVWKKMQEAWRKDVERFFGIFKKQWKILSKGITKRRMRYISKLVQCCLILHNMNVEDNNLAACEAGEESLQVPRHPDDLNQELRRQEVELMLQQANLSSSSGARNDRLREAQDESEFIRLKTALINDTFRKQNKKRKRKK